LIEIGGNQREVADVGDAVVGKLGKLGTVTYLFAVR
jgi:hypothetical protein